MIYSQRKVWALLTEYLTCEMLTSGRRLDIRQIIDVSSPNHELPFRR